MRVELLGGPPSITVAMPTCNGARHLREALSTIQTQQGVVFDWIISDDRSDDQTLAIVRDVVGDRARVSVNSERLGLAGNWNRSVDLSRTDWVAIFHQDDLMRPGHLTGHQDVVDAHPDSRIGIIAGPVEMIDDEGRPIAPGIVDPGGLPTSVDPSGGRARPETIFSPGEWLAFLSTANPLRCSAVTTRKSAHQAVGGFDPTYRYAVDWDFWVKVARDWGLAWRSGPPTVAMRWHLASETHRFRSGTADLDEQVRLLDTIHPRGEVPTLDRRAADRRLARAFLNRAHVALKAGDTDLARSCLDRAIRLSPRVLATMAIDPRLAVQMATLRLAPSRASRWFSRLN